MIDTTVPQYVRVFTQDTPDGKGVFVTFPPNNLNPMVASPFFNSTLPDFDKTFPLPTQGA